MKAITQIFNEKQIEAIKSKIWWVADSEKPFLIKFALHEDFILLQLTDFKSLWVNKFHIKTLMEQKNSYARSLQIKQNRDLLLLFQSLLSASDDQALYIFNELKGSEIHFTFKKRIHIFDFNWTLKLLKVSCDPVKMICREIINPLGATLEAQTKRVEMLRKRFQQIEKQYIRKMSEMEKALYKSPLIQDLEDWKLLVPKQDSKMLNFIRLDEGGKFFHSNYLSQEKKEKASEPVILFEDDRKNKTMTRVMNSGQFELAEHQLNKQLEKQRSNLRKDKKIDFI